MINKLSEIDALEKVELEWKFIPDNILIVIEENKIYKIGGSHGDEKVGIPIQYDSLLIEYDNNSVSIVSYNIAIFLFKEEDTNIKRVFQIMAQFQLLQRKLKK